MSKDGEMGKGLGSFFSSATAHSEDPLKLSNQGEGNVKSNGRANHRINKDPSELEQSIMYWFASKEVVRGDPTALQLSAAKATLQKLQVLKTETTSKPGFS